MTYHFNSFHCGKRFQQLRENSGMPVARAAKFLDVSRQRVYQWEESADLKSHRMLQMCELFGITPDEFYLKGKFEQNKKSPLMRAEFFSFLGRSYRINSLGKLMFGVYHPLFLEASGVGVKEFKNLGVRIDPLRYSPRHVESR